MSETITITLSASLEDYLEAIFHTVKENKVARVKDIAKILKVNNSSVTGALQSLTKKGLINYQPYEIITLTPEGESLARDISNRHHVLQQFLLEILALDQEQASETACRMEHVISQPVMDRLIKFISFVKECPRTGDDWVKKFTHFYKHGKRNKKCPKCLEQCLKKLNKTR